MAWVTLEFAFGSVLTSNKMGQLRDNIAAAFAKDSGAPVLADDYIDNAMIATNAVNADSIVAGGVGASEIADGTVGSAELAANSVRQSELYYLAGTSYAGTLNNMVSVQLTLHELALFPMIHADHQNVLVGGHTTDGANGASPRLSLFNYGGSDGLGGAKTYDVDHYYVSA